ncbi:EF-hand domain-containing protein [Luteolibacter pohnpeiensis]|uniref:EF-hand domain-containing protein n=1 Tax=Luteolibacter pohnpeiensis TaxID=454153 RepID=A0A934VV37_9BACT|nr:EF-hand domain-containing protein [Luteolibacter pohnpeiensis]MBK1883162.1 EF-hand domain-containing protein [Luteolibacter pohnpeiensis]
MKAILLLLPLAISACSSPPGPVVPETAVERQMIGLLQKFDRWDLNGDSELDASELKEASQISGESTATIIQFYDTDHDGKISLKEAQKGYARADEAEKIVNG